MNMTIVSRKLTALDEAVAARTTPFVAPRNVEPRVLMKYDGGALITFGYYGDAESAKSQCPDVGRWFELAHGSDTWRSEDGRVVIVYDYKQAPPAP